VNIRTKLRVPFQRERMREGGREGGRESQPYLMHAVEPLHKDGGSLRGGVAVLVEAGTTGEIMTERDPVFVD